MVFGKKKEAAAKEAAKKAEEAKKSVAPAPAKEEPKKEPKHDLAAKLREQKAKRDAEEKGKEPPKETAKTSSTTDKKPIAQQNAAIDTDWDAKLKEIMKETGEDASAPRPKAKVIIKPDGSKAYVYDTAYGAAISADNKSNKNNQNSQDSKKSNEEEPVKKQSKPMSSNVNADDDMKGFDDFYKWVKNGQMADIRDCEKVMFDKK